MEFHAEALASGFIGCSLAVAVSKYAIAKALGDLDKLSNKVAQISESIAVISVHLGKLGEHDVTLKEHAKKISFFEGLYNDNPKRAIRGHNL